MRLINADKLSAEMYHQAFEVDSDEQRWDSGCWIRYKMFERCLEKQPTINPMKWISCSERLPDIGEHHVSLPCIVYCSTGAYGFSELQENLFGQVGWSCERDDEYHEPLGEVVAWMPLPEPYKEES